MGEGRTGIRGLAVLFLVVQGAGVLVWWLVLLFFPPARAPFLAPDAPESTLFAFIAGDVVIYAGGSFLAAFGIARRRRWAWSALCVNAGAAVYAALYALMLPLLSGGAWLGAIFMFPSLVIMPLLVWLLRPEVSG
jgi:hypothetical protein